MALLLKVLSNQFEILKLIFSLAKELLAKCVNSKCELSSVSISLFVDPVKDRKLDRPLKRTQIIFLAVLNRRLLASLTGHKQTAF